MTCQYLRREGVRKVSNSFQSDPQSGPATHTSIKTPQLHFNGTVRALKGGEDISMMKHLTLSLALVVAMMAIAVEAQATSITGAISFMGSATPTGGSDWSDATGVHFNNPAYAINGTGSYSSIFFTPATFNDFVYDPVLSQAPGNLWTFSSSGNTYSFDLGSLTSVSKGGSAEASSVVVYGVGTLHITGLEDTAGTFVFSGNSADTSFSFSASDGARASVPEPTSVFLLGTGLLGIGVLVQRRNRYQNQRQ
jgi:hypothetical protein